jgi:tRNA-modifying protein YgfZ
MTHSTAHLFQGTCALTHWGLIRAQGPDALSFLHSQLTNDALHLAANEARMAGYCSPKGRLLASFILWRQAQHDVLLACHQSLLAATLKRLSMFVLRAKCQLRDVSAEQPLWGLVGDAAVGAATALEPWQIHESTSTTLLRLPHVAQHSRAIWVGVSPADRPNQPPISLDAWRYLEVLSGHPVIEAATADQLVPQMLNYELIGGINFQKGCYPGQEVVARSQYRGTTKRRMFLFEAPSHAVPGTEVFHTSDPEQPTGLVVNSAPHPEAPGSSFLIEVKLAALTQGQLHLCSVNGPLLIQKALPYTVPTLAEG